MFSPKYQIIKESTAAECIKYVTCFDSFLGYNTSKRLTTLLQSFISLTRPEGLQKPASCIFMFYSKDNRKYEHKYFPIGNIKLIISFLIGQEMVFIYKLKINNLDAEVFLK